MLMWQRINLNVAHQETIKQLSHTFPLNRISHTPLGAIVKLTGSHSQADRRQLTLLFLKPIQPSIIRNVGKTQ